MLPSKRRARFFVMTPRQADLMAWDGRAVPRPSRTDRVARRATMRQKLTAHWPSCTSSGRTTTRMSICAARTAPEASSSSVVTRTRWTTSAESGRRTVSGAQIDIQVVVRPLDVQEGQWAVNFCRVVARRATRSVRPGGGTARPFQAIKSACRGVITKNRARRFDGSKEI